MASTNDDKPFEAGEEIDFCDERFVVMANYGSSGTVRENCANGKKLHPFYWKFEGAVCTRVASAVA